jgi:hypothetical protein
MLGQARGLDPRAGSGTAECRDSTAAGREALFGPVCRKRLIITWARSAQHDWMEPAAERLTLRRLSCHR